MWKYQFENILILSYKILIIRRNFLFVAYYLLQNSTISGRYSLQNSITSLSKICSLWDSFLDLYLQF